MSSKLDDTCSSNIALVWERISWELYVKNSPMIKMINSIIRELYNTVSLALIDNRFIHPPSKHSQHRESYAAAYANALRRSSYADNGYKHQ